MAQRPKRANLPALLEIPEIRLIFSSAYFALNTYIPWLVDRQATESPGTSPIPTTEVH
jgi:hypothetical protein